MGFYKTSFMIMMVVLILSLAIMGVALHTSKGDVNFPPNISKCPDYYVYNPTTNKCEDVKQLSTGGSKDGTSCTNADFNQDIYKAKGTGPQSGICKKKRWAKHCNVPWDGITNNEDICYVINE